MPKVHKKSTIDIQLELLFWINNLLSTSLNFVAYYIVCTLIDHANMTMISLIQTNEIESLSFAVTLLYLLLGHSSHSSIVFCDAYLVRQNSPGEYKVGIVLEFVNKIR
jgi:hypothetical protein